MIVDEYLEVQGRGIYTLESHAVAAVFITLFYQFACEEGGLSWQSCGVRWFAAHFGRPDAEIGDMNRSMHCP